MRHLLTTILSVILLSAAFLAYAKYNNGSENNSLSDSQRTSDAVNDHPFYGDTIYRFDGKTLCYYDGAERGNEVSSIYSDAIITCFGLFPIDTCIVYGGGYYKIDGPIIKFAVGVDTMRYDLRHLPDSINPARDILPPGLVEHKYVHTFALSDSSWDCDFKMLAYLPKNHPSWLNTIIAAVMHSDLRGMYFGDWGGGGLLNKYNSHNKKPVILDGINPANMNLEEIGKHFAKVYEKMYRDKCTMDDFGGNGPKYDYYLEVAPAWRSRDGRYVTYRFYSYYYTMGAHGFMEEYYLTFNEKTGKLLGYEEIIGTKAFPDAIKMLEHQLTDKEVRGREFEGTISAAMEAEDPGVCRNELIDELYKGAFYPRPAMTNQGVVFSYQPYVKGPFSDGVLHFVIHYSSLSLRLPVNIL